jgi:hypothetical protein
MAKQTINLVASNDHPRASLFRNLVGSLEDYAIKEDKTIDYSANYHVFFNFDDTEKDRPEILSELFELRNRGLYTIFDISQEDFMKQDDADYYLLFSAACSFVTCSSEAIQEKLYELTGRLAYLIHNPLDESHFVNTEAFEGGNPTVLWYGQSKDVMSVRPYLTNNIYNIRVATPSVLSHTKDRASVGSIINDKAKEKELANADVVFLPPTFTREGELRRYKKVEESLIAGKYVIAPRLEYDWDQLAFNVELDKGVDYFTLDSKQISATVAARQELLKNKYSKENTLESLKSSLELATEEPIFADIIDTNIEEGFFLS